MILLFYNKKVMESKIEDLISSDFIYQASINNKIEIIDMVVQNWKKTEIDNTLFERIIKSVPNNLQIIEMLYPYFIIREKCVLWAIEMEHEDLLELIIEGYHDILNINSNNHRIRNIIENHNYYYKPQRLPCLCLEGCEKHYKLELEKEEKRRIEVIKKFKNREKINITCWSEMYEEEV